jgi:hypothetical protein
MMDLEENVRFYSRRALQELGLAASSVSLPIKTLHLNMAARYATMRELSMWPHFNDECVSEASIG